MQLERIRIIESVRVRLRERRSQLIRSLAHQSGLDEDTIDDHRLPLSDWMMLGPMANELDRIDRALVLIREDQYGHCDVCSRPIVSERLELNPLARFCLECQVNHDTDWRSIDISRVYK